MLCNCVSATVVVGGRSMSDFSEIAKLSIIEKTNLLGYFAGKIPIKSLTQIECKYACLISEQRWQSKDVYWLPEELNPDNWTSEYIVSL